MAISPNQSSLETAVGFSVRVFLDSTKAEDKVASLSASVSQLVEAVKAFAFAA